MGYPLFRRIQLLLIVAVGRLAVCEVLKPYDSERGWKMMKPCLVEPPLEHRRPRTPGRVWDRLIRYAFRARVSWG